MSMADILEELPRLCDEERELILRQLLALGAGADGEEIPEMLAAIDEGVRSAEAEDGASLEEARVRLAAWTTK